MNKIWTYLDSDIGRLIDTMGVKIRMSVSEKNTVVIAGAPRTGTTLLMEILGNLPKYKTIYGSLNGFRFLLLPNWGAPQNVYSP